MYTLDADLNTLAANLRARAAYKRRRREAAKEACDP